MTTLRALPSFLVASSLFLATTLTGCGQAFTPATAPVAPAVTSERPAANTIRVGGHTLETVRPLSEEEAKILERFTKGYGDDSEEASTYTLQNIPHQAPALRAQIKNQSHILAQTIFKVFDKNKDGKLFLNELGPNADITAGDKNRDGWLSLKEVEADYVISPSELNEQVKQTLKEAADVLAVADTNKNKMLTLAEYRASWDRAFLPAIGATKVDADTVNALFKRYANKKGELSREAVGQVIADGSFSVGLAFFTGIIGLIEAGR